MHGWWILVVLSSILVVLRSSFFRLPFFSLCFFGFFPTQFIYVVYTLCKRKLLRLGNFVLIIPDQSSVVTPGRTHTQTIIARAVPVTMDFNFAPFALNEAVAR